MRTRKTEPRDCLNIREPVEEVDGVDAGGNRRCLVVYGLHRERRSPIEGFAFTDALDGAQPFHFCNLQRAIEQ
jgi:hypothetical protein